MSDYFDNLVVRSFRPLLPAQPIEVSLLAPAPGDSPALSPSTPEGVDRFEDPFAQAEFAEDQLTEAPGEPPPPPPRLPLHKKDPNLRPNFKEDESLGEAVRLENDRRLLKPAPSVQPPGGPEPLKPSNPSIPKSADDALLTPASAQTSKAGPPAGKPVQASAAKPLEPSKLTASTPPARDAAHSDFRPQVRRPEINPVLPLSPSLTQKERPGQRAAPSFRRIQPAVLGQPGPSSNIEGIVVQRISETGERDQPAPLTTLIPRPGPELLLPQTLKARPDNLPPGGPDATEAESRQSDTIINVSIGRIEVRATPARARTEKQRNAPQVMKLDDYLRQRSGGSR